MHTQTHAATFSFPGIIRLNGSKLKHVLLKVPPDKKRLDTFCFPLATSITNRAASIIASHNAHAQFEFPELKSIDKKTAKIIASGKNSLTLGLTNPKPDVLILLAQQKGALELCGMKNINKQQAEAISGYKGNVLEFSALEKLLPEIALLLSKFKGEYLCFPGIKKLSPSVTKTMKNYRGAWLIGDSRK